MNETRTNLYQSVEAATDPRSSSGDHVDLQAGSRQDYENGMRHDQFRQNGMPTHRTSNSDEHYNTTSQPLLAQENEGAGLERQTGFTIVNNNIQPTYHPETPAESLQSREKPRKTLPGWPSSSSPIKTPIYISILNGVFDILLLACSIAFLAFGLVVNIHDQHPTAENQRLTTALLSATKYVLSP
jgi:hypothetical protein